VWYSTSSTSARLAGDTPSTSDVNVGKKKTTVKFPCMLCEGDNYSHLFPRMDEASSLLEKIQLPICYRNIPPNPLLVDGMVNLVPSLVSLVDQVVNLVSSSVEPLAKVADLVPSSISPNFHLKSETQVTDPVPSLVSPTLHLKSAKVVNLILPLVDPTSPSRSVKVTDPVPSSFSPTLHPKSSKVVDLVPPLVDLVPPLVNPTPSLRSAKVVAPIRSSVNPTPPLKNAKIVDLVSPSIDPTLPLESKPDIAHIFLVGTESTVPGGIPPSPVKTPPNNEAILFDWGVITGPRLASHIPLKITIQVCGWTVP
jgi:hypothetical protein